MTTNPTPERLSNIDAELASLHELEAERHSRLAELYTERSELISSLGSTSINGAEIKTEPVVATEAPKPNTKESITEQITSVFVGFNAVVDVMNSGRRKKDVLQGINHETINAEFEAWFTDDKLAYIAAAQESDPNLHFTLVATPNVLASSKEIIKVARAFGENQPYGTYVYDSLYNKYSAEQLSGTNPDNGNSVQFSLIPSAFTPEMSGTVVGQRAKLEKLQADNPDLKVPSVLEGITFWHTLRAQGNSLDSGAVFDRTYIRHFDLPEQRIDDWTYVPYSYVDDDGEPYLYSSYVQYDRYGRVAVG